MDLKKIKSNYDKTYGSRQEFLYDYYKGINVPISTRPSLNGIKKQSHTNLHTDFFSDIISLKVGYMGSKISSELITDSELAQEEWLKFKRITDLDTMNSESVRDASVSGLAHRLLFIEEGEIKAKNILGHQVVYDYKHSPLDADMAFYYYQEEDLEGNITKHCDVYDRQFVTYYVSGDGNDYEQEGAPVAHLFNEVPIVPIQNNDMWFSDCEKSVDLMDQYDIVQSDSIGEIKATRFSLLKIWGTLYTGTDGAGNPIDLETWLKATSSMQFPADSNGAKIGDAEYLEKNINDQVIENSLSRLRTHIFEVSGSIDIKEVSSSQRVFSIKASLMRLENTCATTERYLRSALSKISRLWASIMERFKSIQISGYDVKWTFNRSFPRDLQAEAQTILTLVGTGINLVDALKEVGWENAETIAEGANVIAEDEVFNEINR